MNHHTKPQGRGATINPKGRFERLELEMDEPDDAKAATVKTQLYKDTSASILAFNDSPDVGFSATINPYRGCEHGCIYCYARPTHEYLGLSAGLDFESKLFVKPEAPELLRRALSTKSWKPQPICLSGVTDCYQPIERKLKLTRSCLEVLAEFRNPVIIVTKNHLVTRDIDILRTLTQHQAVSVYISITTLDAGLARSMEPRASRPELRLQAVRELRAAGIPTGVLMAPLIPGLTDAEIPALLGAAADAGALHAGYVILRLPFGVKDLLAEWLEAQYPDRKEKVLGHIREVRGGKLNVSEFGERMSGGGVYAEAIGGLFALQAKKHGLDKPLPALSSAAFRRAEQRQLALF